MSDNEIYQWIQSNITINPETGCHEWNLLARKGEYGVFWYVDRNVTIHRWIYAYCNNLEVLESDQHVLHRCDNPICCNINHLFLGDNDINMEDMYNKGRGRKVKGEQHWKCKLSDNDIKEIRNLLNEGKLSQREIGLIFNVNRSHISRIKLGINR